MVDSQVVLHGQTIAYTLYVIAILLLMSWFGYQITKKGTESFIKPIFFYSFVSFLIILGVSLHLVTHETIPWKPIDLNYKEYTPDKVFEITVKEHQFYLPSDTLKIQKNDMVLFKVLSEDLTYGFGLFRENNSMMFQMQVVPGGENNLLWHFEESGIYSIRSTEYSGWKGSSMELKNVVIVY